MYADGGASGSQRRGEDGIENTVERMLQKKIESSDVSANRLETPRSAGYRAGMTSSGIIGRRLGRLYEVPAETPRRFDELLQVLDHPTSAAE